LKLVAYIDETNKTLLWLKTVLYITKIRKFKNYIYYIPLCR